MLKAHSRNVASGRLVYDLLLSQVVYLQGGIYADGKKTFVGIRIIGCPCRHTWLNRVQHDPRYGTRHRARRRKDTRRGRVGPAKAIINREWSRVE